MPLITHPKCGQKFPGGTRAGHCNACCLTFIGNAAFDNHLDSRGPGPATHVHPAEAVDAKGRPRPYWQDDKGYWHYGQQLTDEQKRELWG